MPLLPVRSTYCKGEAGAQRADAEEGSECGHPGCAGGWKRKTEFHRGLGLGRRVCDAARGNLRPRAPHTF